MRLLIAAIAVVAGFVVGVLGIARLTPDGPDWVWLRLIFAALWMVGLIAGVFLLTNKGRDRSNSITLLIGGVILSALLAVMVFFVEKLPISPFWQRRLVYGLFLVAAFGVWSIFQPDWG